MAAMYKFSPSERLELANKCEVAEQYLYQVLTHRKVASAELSVVIERESNYLVTRQDLRPDDFWLIWPDLPQPTPAQPA